MQISHERRPFGAKQTSARGRASRALVVLTVLAAFVAVMPIVAAIVRPGGGPAVARTAFASAPAGEYVVAANSGEGADVIFVAPATNPDAAIEIATIPHLRGYFARGAVSPEGRRLALVVADGGTPANPVAALYVLNLETAALTRLAATVDYLQTPVWAPDGQSVYFTRTATSGSPLAQVPVFRAGVDGRVENEVLRFDAALGVYPVAFDPAGRLVSVVIDGRGSTAYRDGVEAARLSAQITRDWALSPDGALLAFIEADASAGLRYQAKVISLEGAAGGDVAAQSASAQGQQLGASWKPGAAAPTFGAEPLSAASDGAALAQAASSGFDVPLAYSAAGDYLAVQRWTGSGFASPGHVTIEVVSEDGGRTPLGAFTRFFGWAAR